MKKIISISAAVAVLGLGLTGCSPQGDKADAPKGDEISCEAKPGDVVKNINVSGEHGGEVSVENVKDLPEVQDIQAKVVEKGDGSSVVSAENVKYDMQLTIFNGKTGAKITSEPLKGAALLKENIGIGWLLQYVGCATDKGRTVAVMPVGKIWEDPKRVGLEGIEAKDPIVVITDAKGATQELGEADLLKQAEGAKKDLPEGFPKVDIAENGQPTVSNPDNLENPSELKIANMVEGKGQEVQEGDTVYLHYTGVILRDGKVFDSSWQRGKHASFTTNQVIPGFSKALVGQRVGSRVVALIPPSEGYGSAWLTSQGHKEDDVMVFVVDILGVSAAKK
ncbi:FKBP-type peptidyl-prolyl cis-trans isomerase [Canibacter sp. lx-72]|uniref:FKBP-type peptidyl-prolyl cis-trans isomerase n=1 Tax=Canibacter zhuwentaonis TaxID=2837491 RepID=UPI001BDD26F5|nr:FKBP-type peptidyl-prolyl cis-trans isomerase [Canibacter zhuwentaonis]MBT1017563.1 FKBP-type peptidyl-prolyl cis-trans isomerase [Canibacter zhuwentaonis]MBT1034773.1 FKBP-type peptidyl-prolyl cis-trans isomerase [Canibacter zhuwentaonis]